MVAMALAESREVRGREPGAAERLRERLPSYAAALVLTLLFMGATLPSPLYVIYRHELHFSQVTLTLIYAVYFAGAMATAFFLGRVSDEIGRRVAILAAVFITLRPRIGVPRSLIGAFTAPAVTVFASFALLGFYSALAPSLLQRSLQVESHAIGGAVIFELYAAAVLVLALTHWLAARAAMLCGLALLIPSLAVLVVAFQSHSLALLLTGAALGGGAAALGYRGSLQIVNQIAPDNRRAEMVSTYLMFCYAGVSLPVVGIGLLSAVETPGFAEEIFAVVIAVFALLAIAIDVRRVRG